MSLRNLSDSSVLAGLTRLVRQSRQITAALIAHILEVELRQLYRDMGCGSMREFLVSQLHFSEDAAERRLQAAHAVRRHPMLLERVADGRLHLTALLMIAPHLGEADASEIVEAATHKTRSQIQALLLARKASSTSVPVQPDIALDLGEPAPARVQSDGEPERVRDEPAPARVPQIEGGRLAKIALRQRTRETLRRAHDLLAGSVPFGDHDEVIHRGLIALVERLEKRKFATTSKPHRTQSVSAHPRTIPAPVRRAVRARDGGRCTFAGPTGHRCESRAVEFDHVVPIAHGGASTIANVRLLCRGHNQLEAERVFGREFIERRRVASRPPESSVHADLVAGLRGLGYRATEANEAAAHAMRLARAPLEQRMKAALAWFRPKTIAVAAT